MTDDKKRLYWSEYYKSHKEQKKQTRKKWLENNMEKVKEKNAEWYQANKEIKKAKRSTRMENKI